MIIFKNGTVINGDGKTVLENANVIIDGNEILNVGHGMDASAEEYAEVVDCTGKAILPGMINHHTHGVVRGPFLASGAACRSEKQIISQLDRELLNGHTTVMNVDGFATIDEVKETQKLHPVRIKTATVHLPLSFKAAFTVDGKGLLEKNKNMTVEKMLENGAICIGEVGAGQTTGGGDYVYIPKKVKELKGVDITAEQSYGMFLSVLGRYADRNFYDYDRVALALKIHHLDDILTPEECRDIVHETTFSVYYQALDAYEEAVEAGIRYDVPVLCHHTPSTTEKVQEMAKRGLKTFIPSHSNCLFTAEEAIAVGKILREEYGVCIDAAVFDSFSKRVVGPDPSVLFAMYEENLVDILSTDFAGGNSDSMLKGIEQAVKAGVVSLPKAVATGTTNVARAIPGIAPRLGLIMKGYLADILVVNYPNVSEIQRVYIDGRLVAKDGVRVQQA